jgi:hypothetical protein
MESVRSLIFVATYVKLKATDPRMILFPAHLQCRIASGNELQLLGYIRIPITVRGYSWSFYVLLVKDFVTSVVLGCDLIQRIQLITDMAASHF